MRIFRGLNPARSGWRRKLEKERGSAPMRSVTSINCIPAADSFAGVVSISWPDIVCEFWSSVSDTMNFPGSFLNSTNVVRAPAAVILKIVPFPEKESEGTVSMLPKPAAPRKTGRWLQSERPRMTAANRQE